MSFLLKTLIGSSSSFVYPNLTISPLVKNKPGLSAMGIGNWLAHVNPFRETNYRQMHVSSKIGAQTCPSLGSSFTLVANQEITLKLLIFSPITSLDTIVTTSESWPTCSMRVPTQQSQSGVRLQPGPIRSGNYFNSIIWAFYNQGSERKKCVFTYTQFISF